MTARLAPDTVRSQPAPALRWYDLRRGLGFSSAYRALMVAMGADAAMTIFVRDFLRVGPGDRVLDLGCGPGRLAERLPNVEYWGVDRDPGYIVRAQCALPGGRFLCQDLAGAYVDVPEGHFDLAIALGLLHHLSDAEADAAIETAYRSLAPGGRLITLDCAYVPGQHRIAEALARYDRGRYVRPAGRYRELAAGRFGASRLTVRQDLLRVPYTHAIVESVK